MDALKGNHHTQRAEGWEEGAMKQKAIVLILFFSLLRSVDVPYLIWLIFGKVMGLVHFKWERVGCLQGRGAGEGGERN